MDDYDYDYGFNPWKRSHHPDHIPSLSEEEEYYVNNLARKHPKFNRLAGNEHLTNDTKKAALKVSPSVVALVSYSGDVELSHGCGTIIEADVNNKVTVLTSANLIRRPTEKKYRENSLADNLKVVMYASVDSSSECEICAHDFHFNVLVIKFTSHVPLPIASIRCIDDGLRFRLDEDRSQVGPDSLKLQPGDPVVAVGRYFTKPFDLMVAPGLFSVERCGHDCKELCFVTCNTSGCGDGAPIVNLSGEVIGIACHDWITFCFPINIALKWLDHSKKYGTPHHPCIGFEATNLYVVDIERVERLIRRFPGISGGVVVEKVLPTSCADAAGLKEDDIIVKCDGKTIGSYLELLEVMWDKVGVVVELVVARDDCPNFLTLKIMVDEATPDEINRWQRWMH